MRAADLFCGAGGFTLGLQAAGFEVVFAADRWDSAVESYNLNFDHEAQILDVSTANWNEFDNLSGGLDILCGGPPCQGFSVQRIGRDDDLRNDLIIAFARAVCELTPKTFLMENVPGLLGKRGKTHFALFEKMVREAGYDIDVDVLNAVDFGVPQSRRRVFVLGTHKDIGSPFKLPRSGPLQGVSVRSALHDLPEPWSGKPTEEVDPLHRLIGMSELNKRRISMIPPGGGFEDLPIELRAKCHRAGSSKIGHRGVYGRLAPDLPSGTITARFDSFTRGRFGHPWEPRNITLREGARLQTFPDSHKFLGTQETVAALIGNAVPPLLSMEISKSIFEQLSNRDRCLRAA